MSCSCSDLKKNLISASTYSLGSAIIGQHSDKKGRLSRKKLVGESLSVGLGGYLYDMFLSSMGAEKMPSSMTEMWAMWGHFLSQLGGIVLYEMFMGDKVKVNKVIMDALVIFGSDYVLKMADMSGKEDGRSRNPGYSR